MVQPAFSTESQTLLLDGPVGTVVDWAQDARPGDQLWLVGFSFGAYVSLAAAAELVQMPDTSHFFHRKLMDLRGAIKHVAKDWLPAA